MRQLDGVRVLRAGEAVVFEVDTRRYPLDAVLAAAYVFVDRAWVRLAPVRTGLVRVALTARPTAPADALDSARTHFGNELLGQVLRERNVKRHRKLNEALLAKAFFVAPVEEPLAPLPEVPPEVPAAAAGEPSLSDLPDASADYLDDPYGIAVPWEEKYARKGKGAKKDRGR